MEGTQTTADFASVLANMTPPGYTGRWSLPLSGSARHVLGLNGAIYIDPVEGTKIAKLPSRKSRYCEVRDGRLVCGDRFDVKDFVSLAAKVVCESLLSDAALLQILESRSKLIEPLGHLNRRITQLDRNEIESFYRQLSACLDVKGNPLSPRARLVIDQSRKAALAAFESRRAPMTPVRSSRKQTPLEFSEKD